MRYEIELTPEELEVLRDAVRFADQMTGDGTSEAPTYKLRAKLAALRPISPQPTEGSQ